LSVSEGISMFGDGDGETIRDNNHGRHNLP